MFVSVQIQTELEDSAVLVPDEAVLRSGAKNTVFVALAGGKFEARDVKLGLEAEDGMNQVVSGLSAGERVVTSGQFCSIRKASCARQLTRCRGSLPPQSRKWRS